MAHARDTDPARLARALHTLTLALGALAWIPVAVALPETSTRLPPGATLATTPFDSTPGISVPCLRDVGKYPATTHGTHGGDCTESAPRPPRFSLEMGRQLHAGNGILGKVDGLLVDYELGSGIALNAIAGFPAASSHEQVNPDKRVFGISADTMRLAGDLELSSYLIEERDQDRSISRTLGAVMRFVKPARSTLISLDYDAAASALSTFMISGAWKPLRATTVSAAFDISRHQGHRGREEGFLRQTIASTTGWRWALPIERIRSLSQDDSTDVTSAGLGLSHSFSSRLKLDGDIALLSVSTDAASADNTGPTRSSEYHYHLALTGRDLVMAGDHGALTVRHSVAEASRCSAATLNTRYPITRQWQLNPRLHADYRQDHEESSAQWGISPAVKIEYRWDDGHGFDIETGGTLTQEARPIDDNREMSYFLTLGYRARF